MDPIPESNIPEKRGFGLISANSQQMTYCLADQTDTNVTKCDSILDENGIR